MRTPTAFAVLLALCCAGVACDRGTSQPKLRIEVARDVAEAELFEGASPIEYRECPVRLDLPTQTFRSPTGRTLTFWTDPESRLELETPPVEVVLSLQQTAANSDPAAGEIVVARARFDAASQRKLSDYRDANRHCQLLVSLDGEIRWIETDGSDWSSWVPIGVFDRSSMAYQRLVDDDSEWLIRWERWPELEAAAAATDESSQRALRMLACDAAFREAYEAENPSAVGMLAGELSGIDCAVGD